jgi:hypothetical protein
MFVRFLLIFLLISGPIFADGMPPKLNKDGTIYRECVISNKMEPTPYKIIDYDNLKEKYERECDYSNELRDRIRALDNIIENSKSKKSQYFDKNYFDTEGKTVMREDPLTNYVVIGLLGIIMGAIVF